MGMSQTAIARIWRSFGLEPHRTEPFKLSTDPLGDWDIDEVRHLRVPVLEPVTRDAQPPEVVCDVQALDLKVSDFEEKPTQIPRIVERIYTFEVKFREPPTGAFSGTV
jgi:hypothetical protein